MEKSIIVAVYTASSWLNCGFFHSLQPNRISGRSITHVTHFIPMAFPLLLIVPALALDLLWRPTKTWKSWLQAASTGIVFWRAFLPPVALRELPDVFVVAESRFGRITSHTTILLGLCTIPINFKPQRIHVSSSGSL